MADAHCSEINYENATEMHRQHLLLPTNLISTVENFEKRGHSWFAISQLPSDLSVKVDDMTFYVHKFPVLSRCGYLGQMDLRTSDGYEVTLEKFPGGAETFETVLKFCYGFPVSLTTKNAAPLRCAAEFLDMTEQVEDGNLISKTESFLTLLVFSSWKDSITVLKSCETLSPWAENLQIIRKCCDSIARAPETEENRWKYDVSALRIDHFVRIITSMMLKGLRPDFLGSCIMIYAEKWLMIQTEGKHELKWRIRKQETGFRQNHDQRMIIERLVGILPHEKEGISCKFLLWMLKMAMVYGVSPALVSELEKRVGMVMEDATVYDLLIPAGYTGEEGNQIKSTGEQTVFNVDVVQRILEYYLMHEQQQQQQTQSHEKASISKLLDNYLAEIAGDPNLSVTKFQVIAESLPDNARPCDDGLYRAIDIYLKAHPALSEHERRRLCRAMDCQKLSVDACTHAAQNDRLPLRTVMQVLFAEQLKLWATMHKNPQETNNDDNLDQEDCNCSCPKEEIKTLKVEMKKIMVVIEDLQRDYTNLHQKCEKMRKRQNALSGWILGWNKLKNSTLFQGKQLDSNENREGKEKEKRLSSILRLKRRQSIS